MTSLARAERAALCDLALEVGPDTPTLCGEWTVKDLVVHLLVRERSLTGAPGILFRPLAWRTEQVSERIGRADLPLLVDQLRRPRVSWSTIGPVDRALNTVEYFVHHEDIRRAAAGVQPRALPAKHTATLWSALGAFGRGLARAAKAPVTVRHAGTGETRDLTPGSSDRVTVTGDPGELLLFLYGRQPVVGLEFDGPEDAVAWVRDARYGI